MARSSMRHMALRILRVLVSTRPPWALSLLSAAICRSSWCTLASAARQEAEARRIAEAELAEQRRLQAEENARRQAEEAAARAAEQERLRIAQEQARQQEEEERRAADVEHRRTINNAILMDLMGLGIDEDKAINLIKQIAGNKIEHLSINY